MAGLINSFWGAAGGSTPIFDTYVGAVGYSLRKLKTGETYACKIRRSSDDAETDLELEATGSITLNSTVSAGGDLTTWASTDDVFVKTWYDQSGNNNDATQTTTSEQPQLLSAGALITENSLPAIQFGDPTRLNVTTEFIETNFSWYACITEGTYDVISYLFGYLVSGASIGGTNGTFSSPFVTYAGFQMRGATVRPSGHKLYEWYNDAVFFDNAEDTPYDIDNPLTSARFDTIGGRPDVSTLNFQGKAQELIAYATNENGGDRVSIRGDIAIYYGVT